MAQRGNFPRERLEEQTLPLTPTLSPGRASSPIARPPAGERGHNLQPEQQPGFRCALNSAGAADGAGSGGYPLTLIGLFQIDSEFLSAEPPDYLQRLNPELYEQECRRVRSRFEEAVRLAEEAFLAEFNDLVTHLCERLSGAGDGSPKVFRNTAVTNLTAFFERFRALNVGSHEELDRLVTQARQIVWGLHLPVP
ncbi:MAG: hypothetical protein KDA75_20045 [Planctomycetaceae bacterium]|nr:hypothetical protein [Planctomycetaceae bacterium]